MQTWRRWPPMLVPAVAAVGAARVSARRGKSAPRGEFTSERDDADERRPRSRARHVASVRERRRYVASRRMRAAPCPVADMRPPSPRASPTPAAPPCAPRRARRAAAPCVLRRRADPARPVGLLFEVRAASRSAARATLAASARPFPISTSTCAPASCCAAARSSRPRAPRLPARSELALQRVTPRACRSSAHLLLPPLAAAVATEEERAAAASDARPPAVELALKAAAVGDGRGELLALHIDRCASSALVARRLCAATVGRAVRSVRARGVDGRCLRGSLRTRLHSARRTGGAGRVEGARMAEADTRAARCRHHRRREERFRVQAGRLTAAWWCGVRPALHICGGHAARRHAIGSGRQKAGGGGAWSVARRA